MLPYFETFQIMRSNFLDLVVYRPQVTVAHRIVNGGIQVNRFIAAP